MGLVTDNVIPGNHGKIFGTNATEPKHLEEIKAAIMEIDGIKDVMIDTTVFPAELTVYTTTLVKVTQVEEKVNSVGFHSVPKGLFELDI